MEEHASSNRAANVPFCRNDADSGVELNKDQLMTN